MKKKLKAKWKKKNKWSSLEKIIRAQAMYLDY
jgi:hypothetical protein